MDGVFICPACGWREYLVERLSFRCFCGASYDLARPGEREAFDSAIRAQADLIRKKSKKHS